ncbi:Homeobox Protein Nobox, partial [Manis pentadactyla]
PALQDKRSWTNPEFNTSAFQEAIPSGLTVTAVPVGPDLALLFPGGSVTCSSGTSVGRILNLPPGVPGGNTQWSDRCCPCGSRPGPSCSWRIRHLLFRTCSSGQKKLDEL